jgi:signal transduction histidine kinase
MEPMIYASLQRTGSLLDDYCLQIGALAERRHTELALITAKNQAENAALLAKEAMLQAQAADLAKTKFLANMTHELRTPLNAIIGFSEVIQSDQATSKSAQAEFATYIRDAGLNLLTIVNGVLDLARIEAGKMELDEQLVSLDEVLSSAIRAIRPAAEKKSVEIIRGPETPVLIRIDSPKMIRVLGNLLSNAVKFTEPGGHVAVGSDKENSGELTISVSDTGIGIPAEHLERVLEPFGQVEDHLTRQSEGVGLGLPIARALVGLHDGKIAIHSRLGAGTTVEIQLPAQRVGGLVSAPSSAA